MRTATQRRCAWAIATLCPLVLLVATASHAQAPSLEVRLAPERPGVQDTAQLTVTITGTQKVLSQPELGELSNLQIVGGPSTSRRFSMVNGQTTSSISFIWAVRAIEQGPIRVGPVEVRVEDATLRSGPMTSEAVAGSQQSSRPQPRHPLSPFDDLFGGESQRRTAKVELRLLAESNEVYVGQPLAVTVVLDTTANVSSFEWREAPTFPDWWSQAVEGNDPSSESEQVQVDGVRYWRFPVARFMLIPLRSGQLELPSCSARVMLRSDAFFARPQVVERTAAAATISVLDRPDPPPGFVGAVGQLRYRASAEPKEVELGEPVVVTVTLEGEGSLPLVEDPPSWSGCDGCEWYPPEETSEVTVRAGAIGGARSWQTTLIPRTSGEITLGPLSVAVFDPSRRSYRRQSLGPLSVTVAPPPVTPTPTRAPTTQEVDGDGLDEERVEASANAIPTWIWGVGGVLLGIAFGGLVVWWLLRRPRRLLPPARPGERPAERARTLQAVLEGWWLGRPESKQTDALRGQVDELRRQLEAIRFAPGRADHTETVAHLEEELRKLVR